MKELPIIFSAPMVRAILDGRKTQTRRVVKPSAYQLRYAKDKFGGFADFNEANEAAGIAAQISIGQSLVTCPYGQPGDRLWVRETWRVGAWAEDDGLIAVDYKADGYCRQEWLTVSDENLFDRLWRQSTDDSIQHYGRLARYKWKPGKSPCRWRSSRFMPRLASRVTLEITGVRVEHLNDISEEDAIAEGSQIPVDQLPKSCRQGCLSERTQFARIWNSINGKKYPWESNPWVWVIEFRRAV